MQQIRRLAKTYRNNEILEQIIQALQHPNKTYATNKRKLWKKYLKVLQHRLKIYVTSKYLCNISTNAFAVCTRRHQRFKGANGIACLRQETATICRPVAVITSSSTFPVPFDLLFCQRPWWKSSPCATHADMDERTSMLGFPQSTMHATTTVDIF